MEIINAQIQLRCDSKQNWESVNPVLAEGEPGAIIGGDDHGKIKIGDGVKTWTALPFNSAVFHDNTLSGNGTKDSPLKVVGSQLPGETASGEWELICEDGSEIYSAEDCNVYGSRLYINRSAKLLYEVIEYIEGLNPYYISLGIGMPEGTNQICVGFHKYLAPFVFYQGVNQDWSSFRLVGYNNSSNWSNECPINFFSLTGTQNFDIYQLYVLIPYEES